MYILSLFTKLSCNSPKFLWIIVNYFELHSLSWISVNDYELQWIIVNRYELFWITMNYCELLSITMNYYEIPWSTMKYYEVPWSTMKYDEVLGSLDEIRMVYAWFPHGLAGLNSARSRREALPVLSLYLKLRLLGRDQERGTSST